MRRIMGSILGLLSGCACGGPFVQVDCAAPGLEFEIVDAAGLPVQASAILTFQDTVRVESLPCTPLGTDCQRGRVAVFDAGTYRVEADVGGETFVHEEIVRAEDLDVGECCGGFFGYAVLVVTDAGPRDCADLDVESCAAAPTCAVLSAWPVVDACVDYDARVDQGCGPAEASCDLALTYARAAEGACVVFPNSCIPEGFVPCDAPIPAECPEA